MRKISNPGIKTEMPEFSKRLLIFCLGFFSLLSQVLLFRDFLTVMEGNELAIGLFFFSWLIWVSAGALAGRIKLFSKETVTDNFEFLVLVYIPALMLQQYLLMNIRQISGTAAYEQITLLKAVPLVFMSNATVSFITGVAFVLACKWTAARIPAAAVYISEALGSFAGAVAVTALLFCKFSPGAIIPAASLLLISSSFICLIVSGGKPLRTLTALTLLIINAVFIIGGYGVKIDRHYELRAWERMLPGGEYLGNFLTSQAKYSYGKYSDQFIVSAWGSVYESLPNSFNAIEAAALNLAEKPDAQSVLVAGNGAFSLCSVLSSMEQIKKICWLDPDIEYPGNLLKIIPSGYRGNPGKIKTPSRDIRQFLNANTEKYDLIIMNIPNPSTLALNRYFTLENFTLMKNNLNKNGVLSVSFPGGDNYMGDELSYMGASLFLTMKKTFRNIALKPGDASVFFASEADGVISEDGTLLEKRLSSKDVLTGLYPPENIASSFMKDRIKFQKNRYLEIIGNSGEKELLNSDSGPKSYLYSLLLTVKRAGGVNFKISLLKKTPLLFFLSVAALLLLYGALRLTARPAKFPVKCDIFFTILAASAAGMALNIILMFRYQIAFGSVFLNFGLLSSLFMLGGFAGGMLIEKMTARGISVRHSVPLLTLFFSFFIIFSGMAALSSQVLFGTLFFLSGFFSGAYFPLCAFYAKQSGAGDIPTGSSLEALDSIGGAAGALFTAVIMLPLLGMRMTLALFLLSLGIVFVHSTILSGGRHPGADLP